MKYPCCLIQDLLALFHDGVCSEATGAIVQEHLGECADCRAAYDALAESDAMRLPEPPDRLEEYRKAKSMRALRRRLFRRSMMMRLLAVLLVAALGCVAYLWNEHGEMALPCDDSLHGYYDESGDLVLQGDLCCSVAQISQVLTVAEVDGVRQNHVFLRYYVKPLDYLLCRLAGNRLDSTYIVAFAQQGAQDIDAVHYCTGEFDAGWFSGTGLGDCLTEEQLEQRLDAAVTVWEKP